MKTDQQIQTECRAEAWPAPVLARIWRRLQGDNPQWAYTRCLVRKLEARR